MKANTTCPKCDGADIQRPSGVHLHECENCGHGWDETERLRGENERMRAVVEAARAVIADHARSGVLLNALADALDSEAGRDG